MSPRKGSPRSGSDAALKSPRHSPPGPQTGKLSRQPSMPPSREASAASARFGRALSRAAAAQLALASGTYGARRSPFVAAGKAPLSSASFTGVGATLALDGVACIFASLLTLWVPQQCGPGLDRPCTVVECTDVTTMSSLRLAAFLVNCGTLLSCFVCESIFLWRDFTLFALCDEDRGAPWDALPRLLHAFPRIGARVDAANATAALAATALLLLLCGNLALTAAWAARTAYGGYRTGVVLTALSLPAVRRLVLFRSVAAESGRSRLALPLWSKGWVSLNALDEARARTGEEP